MRILILTPQLPYPPRQGTALRNWGLLSNLARNHEVWLLSFDEQPNTLSILSLSKDEGDRLVSEERETAGAGIAPELRRACREAAVYPVPRRSTSSRLRMLFASSLPDMAWRLWSPDFAARLTEWVGANRFDIIQIEGIELARYALLPGIAGGARVVFDDHNCEYLLQRRACETDARQPRRWHAAAYSFVQWQRLIAFERRMARSAAATLCVSPQDAAAVAGLDPGIQPHIILNGIDMAAYADVQSTQADDHGEAPTLVFTGKMDFRPNIDAMLWFGREVFPLVKSRLSQARLLIVGQRPSPRLDVLRADAAITLTGEVDDVRPYIARAGVYIAPLRVGGGTRFKLLEAMAMRRPIVTTSLGCEGFDVRSGQELLIADTPADFAAAVVRLLGDPALRDALIRRAHQFVAATYDWSVIVPKLESVYKQLTS